MKFDREDSDAEPQCVIFVIDYSARSWSRAISDSANAILEFLLQRDLLESPNSRVGVIRYAEVLKPYSEQIPQTLQMLNIDLGEQLLLSGETSLDDSLKRAAAWATQFSADHPRCRPPIVLHLTGSKWELPVIPAEAWDLQGETGPVLLFQIQVADYSCRPICFPQREPPAAKGLARQLFQLASVFPPDLATLARLPPGSRALIFDADPGKLLPFLHSLLLGETLVWTSIFAGETVSASSAPMPKPAPLPPAPEPASPQIDDNVQFTTYCPKQVKPETYATVLVFAHLDELRDDAPVDEPDPLQEVQRQARSVLGDAVDSYRTATQESNLSIPREGELTFTLEIDGFRCNPPRQTIFWEESVHRVEFRIRASAALDGQTCRGHLRVFLGDLLLAEVTLRISVTSELAAAEPVRTERVAMQRYRKIFASYSRRDMAIVQQFERYAATMGDEYLRDLVHLRSGENWNDGLKRLIQEADVFQLFWSKNSMESPFVRDEWMYALSLNRPNFIRPMYWEQPFPELPPHTPPSSLRDLHFKLLGRFVPNPPPGETPDDEEPAASVLEDDAPAATPGMGDTWVNLPRPVPPVSQSILDDELQSALESDTAVGLPAAKAKPDSVLGFGKPPSPAPPPPPPPPSPPPFDDAPTPLPEVGYGPGSIFEATEEAIPFEPNSGNAPSHSVGSPPPAPSMPAGSWRDAATESNIPHDHGRTKIGVWIIVGFVTLAALIGFVAWRMLG